LLKTASQLDCDDSYLESIPNQEMLTVQDLDTHTNLKLTSAMFKRMSTLKPGLKVQDQIFDKYMMDLKHALKQLFELAHEGDTNKICELIRKYPLSLNVTSPDSTENTLLHIAAKYGHSSLMDYLLSQNKQLLNIVNKYDRTPIIFLMVWHPSLLRHILV
jgi:ankyrin repeat protein